MDVLREIVYTDMVSLFPKVYIYHKTLPEESGQHFLAVEVKTNGECV